MRIEKLTAGRWRVTCEDGYACIKRDRDGWSVRIRNNAGDPISWAGVWKTKRDAVESAEFVLSRLA